MPLSADPPFSVNTESRISSLPVFRESRPKVVEPVIRDDAREIHSESLVSTPTPLASRSTYWSPTVPALTRSTPIVQFSIVPPLPITPAPLTRNRPWWSMIRRPTGAPLLERLTRFASTVAFSTSTAVPFVDAIVPEPIVIPAASRMNNPVAPLDAISRESKVP